MSKMKVLYATDHCSYFVNGKVYLSSRIYPILQRYAKIFDNIILYSRFIEVDNPPEDAVCDPFICGYIRVRSLKEVLLKRDRQLMQVIKECSMVIGRVPAFSAYKALDYAKKLKIPTFAEAMGCAWDAYWNHGLLGKLAAPYMFLKMRSLVYHASFASYVTSDFLQRRYPRKVESLAASNVLIKNIDEDIWSRRLETISQREPNTLKLMTTAAVDVRYKGQEYVIRAIPKLKRQGIHVKYYIVGDGNQDYLKSVTKKNHVENEVTFTGRLSLTEVFSLLDKIDVYLQPSLQEGLPRSVVEAMSRGCIVSGADTAGIPELIDRKYVVKRKSSEAIADLLCQINTFSTDQWISSARRNFEKAMEFKEEVLNERRYAYYQAVKRAISR